MQFRDLGRQYQRLKPQMDQAMLGVVKESRVYFRASGTGTGSGAGAVCGRKALRDLRQRCRCALTGASGLERGGGGDAIFVPDFTFFSTAETPRDRGAVPIFVDVKESTFNMDADSLEKCIQEVLARGELKPKAIISVDLFGMPADYERMKIAKKYDLLLLEGAAQGFGGSLKGRKACVPLAMRRPPAFSRQSRWDAMATAARFYRRRRLSGAGALLCGAWQGRR